MALIKPLKFGSNGVVSEAESGDTVAAPAAVKRTRTTFTATAGQTAFTVPAYSVGLGLVDVRFNGSELDETDFTETNSTTVTLNAASALNDKITIITYDEASVSGMTEELMIAYSITL